jgi:TRAP-type uncharacterized transport system fused permease subunit
MTKALIALLVSLYHGYLAYRGLAMAEPWRYLPAVFLALGIFLVIAAFRARNELRQYWLLFFSMLCLFATSHVLVQNGVADDLAKGTANSSWLFSALIVGMLLLFTAHRRSDTS